MTESILFHIFVLALLAVITFLLEEIKRKL